MDERDKDRPVSVEEAIAEAKRYYKNAKDILKEVPVEYGIYKDGKKVREACAIGYLSALFAIDAFILSKGKKPSELPTSYQGYRDWLKKAPHNGKLLAAFRIVYENLHIFGYYRGGVNVDMVKAGFKYARVIIDTFSKLFEK